MARSSGSIHIADNSVVAINDALQQLLFMLDELRGEHDTPDITIGPHSHTTGTGELISHDTGLSDVSADDHHTEDHQARHNEGGLDELKLDDLGIPDNNTDLDASVSLHGLMQKYPNDASKYLDGSGTFSTVPGSTEATDTGMAEAQESSALFEEILSLDGTVTITSLANGSAVSLSASVGSGSTSLARTLMLMGA